MPNYTLNQGYMPDNDCDTKVAEEQHRIAESCATVSICF